jgi:hypothetical protein
MTFNLVHLQRIYLTLIKIELMPILIKILKMLTKEQIDQLNIVIGIHATELLLCRMNGLDAIAAENEAIAILLKNDLSGATTEEYSDEDENVYYDENV